MSHATPVPQPTSNAAIQPTVPLQGSVRGMQLPALAQTKSCSNRDPNSSLYLQKLLLQGTEGNHGSGLYTLNLSLLEKKPHNTLRHMEMQITSKLYVTEWGEEREKTNRRISRSRRREREKERKTPMSLSFVQPKAISICKLH